MRAFIEAYRMTRRKKHGAGHSPIGQALMLGIMAQSIASQPRRWNPWRWYIKRWMGRASKPRLREVVSLAASPRYWYLRVNRPDLALRLHERVAKHVGDSRTAALHILQANSLRKRLST